MLPATRIAPSVTRRLVAPVQFASTRTQLRSVQTASLLSHLTIAALDIDFSDPDTQVGVLGAVLGLTLGIGAPIFYSLRDDRDEERLEELRALNRAVKEETGEYMSEEEIASIRPPRWTDRREFVDDD